MLFQLQKTLTACLLLSWAVPGSDIDWSAKLRKCKHKNKRRGNWKETFYCSPTFSQITHLYFCMHFTSTGHPYYLRAWNRLLLSKGPEGGLPIPFPSHHFFPNPTNQCPDPTDMLTKYQSHSHFVLFFSLKSQSQRPKSHFPIANPNSHFTPSARSFPSAFYKIFNIIKVLSWRA